MSSCPHRSKSVIMPRYAASVVLLVVICGIWEAEPATWSYTDPRTGANKWPQNFRSCNGWKQSPINLRYKAAKSDSRLKPVRMFVKKGAVLRNLKFTVTNNDHTAEVKLPKDLFFISFRRNDTEQFSIDSVNFHWGTSDNIGSEHEFDGVRKTLETQIVSYNKDFYKSFSEAAGAPNGLAILGFLHDLRAYTQNSRTQLFVMPGLAEALKKIVRPGSKFTIPAFNLTNVMSQVDPNKYFRYEGSLTTPPCTENVLWTVFTSEIPILPNQTALFRGLKYPKYERLANMTNNVRPIQQLGDADVFPERVIYRAGT